MNLRFSSALCFMACIVVGAMLSAHQGDPKARARNPYNGPGYRRGNSTPGGPTPFGPQTGFPANDVILLSWLPLGEFGSDVQSGNDCWGYVSASGREYALFGNSRGTGVVEITDPSRAHLVAQIEGPSSLWRDIKVYQQFAYAVSEGGDGIQVLDLSEVDRGTVTLVDTITAGGGESSHNVAINETSGFLYRCGGGNNGLRIYDLSDPASPVFVGEWPDRYVHDAQVVTYTSGPYTGREIAFCCSGFNGGWLETGLDIVDVTDKSNPFLVKRLLYQDGQYSHQAWLSEDRRFLFLNDEADEESLGIPTDTKVIDVSDIDNPLEVTTFTNGKAAIGHNLYVRGDTIFEANYRSGLRVFDASDPTDTVEVAFFDTYPESDSVGFEGLWSVYPYFPTGTVIGSDIDRGLFVWHVGPLPLEFGYPNGRPGVVSPAGGDTLQVEITSGTNDLAAGTPRLHYEAGNGLEEVPLVPVGGSLYEATFPALPCGITLSYHLTAETTTGIVVTDPPFGPPPVYTALIALESGLDFVIDMESNTGWTIGAPGDDATSGIWERVNPIGTIAQPANDHTDAPGLFCWVTGQGSLGGSADENDVDGGQTTLISRPVDLSGLAEPKMSYWRWYSNAQGPTPNTDVFIVDISNDGGATWINVETVGPGGAETEGGWFLHEFPVADFVDPAAFIRLRFIASDEGEESLIEAAIDDFGFAEAACLDCNGNGISDATDISRGVSEDLDGNGIPDECECTQPFIRGDVNANGGIALDDGVDLLGWLFAMGPDPVPLEAADANDDDHFNLGDGSYLLQYLFMNGPEPPAPFPEPGCAD